jgi:hypothetical protein
MQICNAYWFSTGIMIRERASVLRYMYIGCLVDVELSVLLELLQEVVR